jgi:hypothetical protein
MIQKKKSVEVGKTYRYPWPDKMSVGEYTVTAVNEKNYDAVWSNGVPISIRFGCPINLGSEEFNISTLPILPCDDSWLDARVGDTFFIEGTIDEEIRYDTESFLIQDQNWNQITVKFMVSFNGSHVGKYGRTRVRVVRTEDGLETTTAWLYKI